MCIKVWHSKYSKKKFPILLDLYEMNSPPSHRQSMQVAYKFGGGLCWELLF
jgi:hypothetical protein